MPFTGQSVMDSRLGFVAACLKKEVPIGDLCTQYGISRKTGYKWLSRYLELGALGLAEQSRAPKTMPWRISAETEAAILGLRGRFPTWGPRKLRARLALDIPDKDWPAASTIGDLLRRKDLSRARRIRRPGGAGHGPPPTPQAANEIWSADFKGWFCTGDRVRCEPLTITDNFSRFLIRCEAVPRTDMESVIPLFERSFRELGLPRTLRTDNGHPFGMSRGLGGMTRFSVWLVKLGIMPEYITPGRPDQNGRHERMHRTLAEDAATPPAHTLREQQARFDIWRQDYNHYRPHEALGQKCPASIYTASDRPFPNRINDWDYPADHYALPVTAKGLIRWRGNSLYISEAFAHETVAMAQRDDGDWTIRFRWIDLATVSDEKAQIVRSKLARTSQL